MKKINIAITYNPSVSGPVLSLRKVLDDFDIQRIDCDYQKICPPVANIEVIFADNKKMSAAFRLAKRNAVTFLRNIDCLILSGNPAMIDPRFYGFPADIEQTDISRAIAEMALIHVALQIGMPILAICGGLQLLNVYLGGTIKDLNQNEILQQGFAEYRPIKVGSQSFLGNIFKSVEDCTDQNVFGSHFQVLDKLGGKKRILGQQPYLKVCARTYDEHNNIEAVESQFGAPVLGVQFHPEVAVKGLDVPALPKGVSGNIYIADDVKDIENNKNVFKFFIHAATAFANKRAVNDVINRKPDPARINDNKKPSNYLAIQKDITDSYIKERFKLLAKKNQLHSQSSPTKTSLARKP